MADSGERDMVWKNVGGGCGCCCRANYPCDDEYEHSVTGERRTVYSTMDAHFNMPSEVEEFDSLYRREGVMQEWQSNDHLSCQGDVVSAHE